MCGLQGTFLTMGLLVRLRVAELERGHETLQRELAEMRRTLHDAPTAPASPPAR